MCIIYSLYSKFSYRKVYTAPPYLHLALGHRWPWDQVGGARVGRGAVALRCLGCVPTITSSIRGVKDAQRSQDSPSGRSIHHFAIQLGIQSWLYTIGRQPPRIVTARLSGYTAYTAHTALQPYSHTRHTSYSAIQPPSDRGCTRLDAWVHAGTRALAARFRCGQPR